MLMLEVEIKNMFQAETAKGASLSISAVRTGPGNPGKPWKSV